MLARLRQSGGDLLVSSTARSHLLFATATESRLIMPTLPDPAFQKPGPSLSGLKVLHRLLHSSVPVTKCAGGCKSVYGIPWKRCNRACAKS